MTAFSAGATHSASTARASWWERPLPPARSPRRRGASYAVDDVLVDPFTSR